MKDSLSFSSSSYKLNIYFSKLLTVMNADLVLDYCLRRKSVVRITTGNQALDLGGKLCFMTFLFSLSRKS